MEHTFEYNLKNYCAPGCRTAREQFRAAKGVLLTYYSFHPEAGSRKDPVLFIPGWVSRMDGWRDILETLTKDRSVYYLETREKASSVVDPDTEQSVEAIAADIREFVRQKAFRDKEYVLFGPSLGATAILDADPDLTAAPKALILVGPNAVFHIPLWARFVIHLLSPGQYRWFKWLIRWYLKHFRLNVREDAAQYSKYSAALDIADPWKLKRSALALARYSVWHQLPRIKDAVLLVNAGKDVMHVPENIETMHRRLADSQILDMNTNSGTHSPELVQAIDRFLGEISARRR